VPSFGISVAKIILKAILAILEIIPPVHPFS
jgi:hypothetical protein